ncbi:tetratricopeptide repeat protein [Microcoleus sp. PH2017_13_LAR_U_A]|nr:tetratricopeptide repeat protein [Microcoleus sp. PH2017_13_LAR_U_A]
MVFNALEKKRMNIDLKSEEERVNLLPDFVDFQEKCLSNSPNSNNYFDKLIKIWDLISEILWAQGYWKHYLECGKIALNCATKLKKRDIEGRILNELGWAQMEQEEFDIAQRCFSDSLQVFEEIGDRISQGQSIRYLGVLHFRRRYFGLALKCYQNALTIVQEELEILQEELKLKPLDRRLNELNQRVLHQQAELHNVLGNLYLKLWNVNTSRQEFIAGLQGFRNLQKLYISPTPSSYLYFQPAPLLNLGRVAMLSGRYRKAQHYFDRCDRLCERIDRPDTKAGVLLRMAELAKLQGKKKEAEELAKEAEKIVGDEVQPLRNRAQNFRTQMRGVRTEQLKALRHKIRMLVTLTIDLLFNAPLVLLQSIGYYALFIGAKLVAKMRR